MIFGGWNAMVYWVSASRVELHWLIQKPVFLHIQEGTWKSTVQEHLELIFMQELRSPGLSFAEGVSQWEDAKDDCWTLLTHPLLRSLTKISRHVWKGPHFSGAVFVISNKMTTVFIKTNGAPIKGEHENQPSRRMYRLDSVKQEHF